MKTSKTNKLLSLALAGSFSLFGATNAFADANDDILNRATIGYSVGGAAQPAIESSLAGNSTPGVGNGTDTVFKEDRLINFTVANSGATGDVTPGGTLQATEFVVTNSSNTALDFLLLGLNNADGTVDPFSANLDEFDGLVVQTFVEDGTTVGFQPAEDTATFITGLAEGANQTVYVVSTIPLVDSGANPLVNGNVATMTLVAQAAENGGTGDGTGAIMNDNNDHASPGGVGFTNGAATLTTAVVAGTLDDPAAMDTVFNDDAGSQDGTGAADVIQNAQHSANNSYTIQSAELTITKSALAHFDPVNLNSNPKAIPSAIVRYTITIENAAGAAVATLTDVTDVLAMLMDTQFGDTDVANTALSGADNVRITDGLGAVTFCQADNADANADGCTWNGTAGDTLTVDLTVAAGTDQLLAGQTLTVEFDVIVP